jgi:DNA polymerase-3 subunit alpha
MGKKKKEVLDAEYVGFEAGMRERGFSPQSIKALWDVLVPFSDYAFNKAHSAAYGLVSYWTAYLKANYPAEYMAAVLTSVKDDKDKMAIYLNECRRMGIKVLPPDVNESDSNFTPVGTDVRFGLSAIRNVGVNVVAEIVAARESEGRFTDFVDFIDKVPLPVCNKRVIESLAKAGSFDSMHHARRAVVAVHEQAVDEAIDLKRNEAHGQFDLFSMGDDEAGDGNSRLTVTVPEIEEWDKATKLAHERDMLGLYVSDHPLFGVEHVLSNGTDCTIGQLLADDDRPDGTQVTIGGLVTSVQRKVNKRGDIYAIVTVEDLEGSIEVMMFSSAYQLAAHLLVNDAIILLKGRVRRRDDRIELSGSDVTVPDLTQGRPVRW